MGFGLELEITGDNTGIVSALKETNTEYAKTGAGAVKETDAMAAAAERAGKAVNDLAKRSTTMASGFQSSSAVAAKSVSEQAAAIDRSRAIMNDYGSALEAARGHVHAYAEAMQDSAEMQARSAARTVQANESMRSRVVSAFEALRTKVKTVTAEIAASWTAAVQKMGPEKFEAAAKRMGEASEELQRRVSRAWKAIGVAAVALTTATFIVGASFEQAMARVGSTVGATTPELAAMSAEAKRWGDRTSFGAKQVAEAMLVAGDSIGNAAETIAATGPIVQLAGARNIGLAESADLVTQALDAYNLSGTEAARVANVLAASAGKVDMNSVRAGLSAVAAAAGNVGLSIEETVAMLALLDQGGQKATKSAAGLQGIFSSLLNPSDELKKLMGGLTLESNGLMAVMQQLASQGSAALATAFDARQLQVIITLAKAGPAAFNEMTAALTGTNAAQVMFARNQAAVQSSFLALKNTITGIMIDAFQQLSGTAASAIESMRAGLERYKPVIIGAVIVVRDFITEHKDLILTAAKVVAVMAGIGFVVGSIIIPLKLLVSAWTTVGAAMTIARTVAALMSPVFTAAAGAALRLVLALAGLVGWPALIGVAAAALIAFGVHMYRTNETFRNVIRSILDAAKSFGQFLFDVMTWPVRKIVEVFDKGLAFIGKLFPGVEGAVRSSMEAIKNIGGDVWDGIAGGAEKAFDWTKNRAADAKTALGSAAGAVQGAWEGSFLNIGAASDKLFGDLRNKALAAQGLMTEVPTQPKLPSAENRGGGGGSLGGGTGEKAERFSGGGVSSAPQLAAMVGANLAAFAQIEDAWRASQIMMAGTAPMYTAEWLTAREALINDAYAKDVAAADGSSARIAELTLQRDTDLSAAVQANQDEIVKHWVEGHDVMVLAIGGLSAAYDTAVDLIIRAETNLKNIREALWMSFKRSVIAGAAQMFKAYVGEQIKALIISDAAKEVSARKGKIHDAKAGAVAAFHAFAGIPFIGPALGAAAAVAAFAFLIAFHSGGYVGRMAQSKFRGNEVPAVLERGEYVVRRQAVAQLGTNTLDHMNRTGQMPQQQATASSPSFVFQISGSNQAQDDKAWIEDVIIPQLEDRFKNGRFRLATA